LSASPPTPRSGGSFERPRGQFLLTIQRKEGKSAIELRAEAEDQATAASARLNELLTTIRHPLDAYLSMTGTLELLLDAISRGMDAARAQPGMAAADIIAAIQNRLRREDRTTIDLPSETLPAHIGRVLDERRAARALLDRQDVATAMERAPHLRDAYMAYKQIRETNDNHT